MGKKVLGKSPIQKNIIANFYGIGVRLLNQIVLVPLYIIYWGSELYSDWIIISAMTVIFSMSDIGLNNVIQNRFSMRFAENNISECKSLLSNNILIVSVIFAIALIFTMIYLVCFDILESMGLHLLSRMEASIIFLLLVCRVFIGMYSGIENAVYLANHKAFRAVYMDQTAMLCVVIITIFCLLLHISMVYMCILFCLPYLVLILIKRFDTVKYFPYPISFSDVNVKSLKGLLLPSISFMSFPLGNAIVLQGYTLVVNKYFGADSVVLFNTTRTMCNFMKTFLSTIQNSAWPEYSIAYGSGNYERMRGLHRKVLHTTLLCTLVMCILLSVAGPAIYKIWVHDEVSFQYPLMYAFLIVLSLEMIWTSSGITLMATNNHIKMGIVYVVGAFISIAIGSLIASCYPKLEWVEYSLVIMQLSLIIFTVNSSLKLTKDKFINLFTVYPKGHGDSLRKTDSAS